MSRWAAAAGPRPLLVVYFEGMDTDAGSGPILTVIGSWDSQVAFTAVHAGHDLRDEVREGPDW